MTKQFFTIVVLVVVVSSDGFSQGNIAPFTEEAQERGLTYVMQGWPQSNGHFGFGCAFADLDGDGDPDIITLGAENGLVGIFENDGNGYFTDRSSQSGIPFLPQASGVAAADYDGDGDMDLYLTQIGENNLLARNDGDFQFQDVAAQANVTNVDGASESACFGDFDGDGWLDLFVANYRKLTPDDRSRLYRNNGDGTFDDVSAAQTTDDEGYGFQAVWFDYDLDNDVDLYLSNDKGYLPPFITNQLWRNDNGQLVNVSEPSGANVALYSMGLACGDFTGDAWPDVYCTNIPGGGGMDNPLLINQRDGKFREGGESAGVHNPFVSWGSIFFDFDNNGCQDLYVNNMVDPNTFYSTAGDWPCEEVAQRAGVEASQGPSFSSAVADIDDDGDLDLLVNNLSGNVELFINHEGQKRHWLKVRLLGLQKNLHAVGGRVEIRIGDTWQLREILAGGNGYLGQNELLLHFGLDSAVVIDELVATWPNGIATRVLRQVAVDQTLTLSPAPNPGGVPKRVR